MILRCTTRLLGLLGARPSTLPEVEPDDDDWYANLLWLDRRKCLLLAHAGTLFPVFAADVLKADLVPVGPAIVRLINGALTDAQLPEDTFGSLDPDHLTIARTASRVVLGYMNEMARYCEYAVLGEGGLSNLDIDSVSRALREEIHLSHLPPGYFVPMDLAEARAKGSATVGARPTLRVLE